MTEKTVLRGVLEVFGSIRYSVESEEGANSELR
jgi:hypothetical protein